MKSQHSKQALIFRLLFLLFLIVSIFLSVNIAMNVYSRYSARTMMDSLKDEKPSPPKISDENINQAAIDDKDTNVKTINLNISEKPQMLKELKSKNPDTIAWIEIPGTGIDYPVMQSDTNSYYLRRTFNRQYNITGSIFADYRNSPDFDNQNTVIYGHNMRDGSMFYDVSLFMDKNFYKDHNKIIITLDNRILEYTVFSIYETQKDYDYRSPDFDKLSFESKLTEFKEKSLIQSDVILSDKSKIITLSTCAYTFKDSRIALHAVLTSITEF
ncbi:class B sortase [Proteocatella sphenisci]|uniref:class B sortase n=1 Tax=Proteocatella sphenisci TaxID=181070 RepID=UPI0004AED0EA|nr:class B sortase [Proteocatella sphenisci]